MSMLISFNVQNVVNELDNVLKHSGLNRVHFTDVDVAWGFRENEPVIAVISDQDFDEVFQSIMRIFWSSAEYIVKPWSLFLDIEKVPPRHQQALEVLSKQYRIQIINRNELLAAVNKELSTLATLLKAYIPKNSKNPLKALGDSIVKWKEEKPTHGFIHDVSVETGDLKIYEENGELRQNRKTIPLKAKSNGVKVNDVLLRVISVNDGVLFDTEHRNLPMVFRLKISQTPQLTFRFEADKCNLIEATSFWSLYYDYLATNRLVFIDSNSGNIVFDCLREVNGKGDN